MKEVKDVRATGHRRAGSAMDRRRFLAGAGAASLAWMGSAAPAAGGGFTGKIRKAVKFQMVEEKLSVLDKFKLLVDLGYDGTEIRTGDKVDSAEVSAAIEKTGLPVHGVIHSSSPDIAAAIELSKAWGGTSVLVVCRYDQKASLAANWERDQATIRAAIPAAEKHGVKILVENVWASYLISAFDVQRFLDEIGSPWVWSYFDVGNNVRRELAAIGFEGWATAEALEASGHAANTIVIYTSDHGLAVGSHGLRGKQNMYEHTVNVPLVICGPGIPEGVSSDAQVYLRELFPTTCELAGVPIPDNVEGTSFARILEGEAASEREEAFCYFRDCQRMVREDRWKLIFYPQIGLCQLFDLKQDSGEMADLAADPRHAETRRRLEEKLARWREEVDDPVREGLGP